MNKSQIRVGDILRADWTGGVYKIRCLELVPSDPNCIYAEILHPPHWPKHTFATIGTLSRWGYPCPMEANHVPME